MNIDPCPFCANTAEEVFFTEDYFAHAICRVCGTCGPSVAIFEMPPGSSARNSAISLWNTRPLSLPSSDDKTPTAATGEAGNGTPEFASHSVGDRVGILGKETGVIERIDSGGMAYIKLDQGGWDYRDLCVLTNLTRLEAKP